MQRTAYTSTITDWRSAAAAMALTLALATAVVLLAGSSSAALAASLGTATLLGGVIAAHLATIRLSVSTEGVAVGAGARGRTRWIPAGLIARSEVVQLDWPQVFGVGLPMRWRTTRLTVGPGTTLALLLRSGEQIWISAPDPATAASVLSSYDVGETKEIV